jgi:hypothetical protein
MPLQIGIIQMGMIGVTLLKEILTKNMVAILDVAWRVQPFMARV